MSGSAGWYLDPNGSDIFRWWDGEQWTGYTYDEQMPEPASPPVWHATRQDQSDDVWDDDDLAPVAVGLIDAVGFAFTSGYARFAGRASRSEFWWWYLSVCVFIAWAAALILVAEDFATDLVAEAIAWVFVFGTIIAVLPSIAVGVRRLHDTGKSGWFLLLGLIPFGSLVLLVLFALPSDPGPNRYGPGPELQQPLY